MKVFSKQQALRVGFQMTRKYIWDLLPILSILLVFNFITTGIDEQSGWKIYNKTMLEEAVGNEEYAAAIFDDMVSNDYFTEQGLRQAPIQRLDSAADLVISSDFEEYREEVFEFLQNYKYRLPVSTGIYHAWSLISWLFSMLMGIGLNCISLSLARDQKPKISDLFAHTALLPTYVITTVVYTILVLAGLVCLVVPGIILAVMLQLYSFLIADEGMGVKESLATSRFLTRGYRWDLFVFGWIILLINFLGFLCLGIGLLFTFPATFAALAYIFDQLRHPTQENYVSAVSEEI